ncbi:MAG TPA: pitrilysin family protein [Terriglobia bacterium]|nr:pitrilysin family protein [Terriglobia bacterium]
MTVRQPGTGARLLLLAAALFAAMRPALLRAQDGEHSAPASTRGDRHSEGWERAMRLKGPPLPPKFPRIGGEIERTVLENGLVLYMQEDHRLPLLDVTVLVRTGSYYEAPEELRTASLLGELLRTGGTKSYSPEELDERLDFIAAELSVSMQAEQCSVSLNVPAKDAPEALRILAEVLRYPALDAERLELEKQQALYALRASNDSPSSVLQREFRRLLYTEAHPGGRYPTFERIRAITREDLLRFHQKFFHPNQIMIGVVGDFQRAEMLATMKALFGDWPRQEVALPPLPKVNPTPRPGVFYVQKAVNQSNLWLAHWGVNRENPDRFAIDLMNDILGGSGLNSRLAERVRNDEGLAYSVGSFYNTGLRDVNFFVALAQTKTESTVQAIQSMIDEIQKMRSGSISKNEFDSAKEMFLYSQVFRFAEPARALSALMNLEYEGLPMDYLEKEFASYQAVTAADIQRVARQYLRPEQLTIFIVGDATKFKEQAAALGPVQEITPFQFGGEERSSAQP